MKLYTIRFSIKHPGFKETSPSREGDVVAKVIHLDRAVQIVSWMLYLVNIEQIFSSSQKVPWNV